MERTIELLEMVVEKLKDKRLYSAVELLEPVLEVAYKEEEYYQNIEKMFLKLP